MPFGLYRAPVSTVAEVSYDGTCLLCRQPAGVLFGLRLNDYVIRPCISCHRSLGLRMGWWDDPPGNTDCSHCGTSNPWPPELPRDPLTVCYACICMGRVAIGHETEIGFIDYARSLRGMIDSSDRTRAEAEARGLRTTVLKTYDDGSESIGVYVPTNILQEIQRTPRYSNLQREYWPYHCGAFMAFVGRWQQEDFERVSGGNGLAWFMEHGAYDFEYDEWDWLPNSIGWSYVHKCLKCGVHRVFVDSD